MAFSSLTIYLTIGLILFFIIYPLILYPIIARKTPKEITGKERQKLIFKKINKITLCIIGTGIIGILLFPLYTRTHIEKRQNEIGQTAVRTILGSKLSECQINDQGFYDGKYVGWFLFRDAQKWEGKFKDGYYHGRLKEYGEDGNILYVREYNNGKLVNAFKQSEGELLQLPPDKWPRIPVNQKRPARVKLKTL